MAYVYRPSMSGPLCIQEEGSKDGPAQKGARVNGLARLPAHLKELRETLLPLNASGAGLKAARRPKPEA